MDKQALAAEYVRLIGYDPFEDDHSITEEEVAQTLKEYKEEAARAEAESLIERAIAARTARGLKLTFLIPADHIGPEREFSCYPKDEATKLRWIASKTAAGWKLLA